MNFTLDANKKQTSFTGFSAVAALHVVLLVALIYGAKSPLIPVSHPPEYVYVPPAVKEPEPVRHVEKLKPVKFPEPVMPLTHPPVTDDNIVVPPTNTTIVDRWPTGASVEAEPKDGGEGGAVVSKPAAVFIAALVEAKSCDKPEYPRMALRNEYTGTVSLALLVGPDGKVSNSRIEKSSGHKELDEAARAGLSLCRFTPATLDGKPQEAWAKLQYVWKMD